MIVISGSIVSTPEAFNEVFELSLAHTQRARTVAGCLMHSVHVDAENGLRLVFLEHWADRASVLAHFADQRSKEFIERVRDLATEPPGIHIFEGTEIGMRDLMAPPAKTKD
jgi:quinol monooxygenase YgiN